MKKRIAIFGIKYFPSRGGTSRVAENLILQLKDKYKITIYCYPDPNAKSHMNNVNVVEINPFLPGAPGALLFFLQSAIHLLLMGKTDLVHVHKTDSALFIPLLKLRYRIIATSHEAPYTRDKWNWFMKLYFHLVELLFIYTPDVRTCISEPLTDYYKRRYKRIVYFIPNGINPADERDFDYNKAVAFLPENASIDKPFILFAARRLMRTKGCHTMLKALKEIKYKEQIFIAGEWVHSSKYIDELKTLSKDLNVFFLGFVNPLSALYALLKKSELFVFPSETEGMSIMLLEVASVGRPMVVSDIPENTQVFNKDEVLYFKNKNSNDLAKKITYALENSTGMMEMAQRAKSKVLRDFNWEKIANVYEQLYDGA